MSEPTLSWLKTPKDFRMEIFERPCKLYNVQGDPESKSLPC